MQEDLDTWDPLREEYNSVAFNCYTAGPGANLPLENLPPFSKEARQNKSRTLCIKNVPVELTEVGLKHLFNCFGKVLSVRKLGPRPEYPGKTIAFIDYGTTAEALDAIQMLHDKPPFHLKVNIAMSLQERRKIEQRQKEEMDVIYKQIEQAKAVIEPTRTTPKLGLGRGKVPQKVFTLNDLKNIKVTLGQGVGQRSIKSSDSSTISSSSASFKTTRDYVADSDSSGDAGPRRICSLCGKKADLRCSICLIIYCSRECQVKDWPDHLKECLKKAGQKRSGKSCSFSNSDVNSQGDHAQSNGVPQLPLPKSTQGKSPQKPSSALGQHLAQNAKSEKTTPAPPKVVKLDEVKLPPGEKVEVTICHAASLDDIYLQLISSQAALGEMHIRLQSLCKGAMGYKPKEGDVCAAIFSGEWYRASVIQVLTTGGGCQVYFLDYGNESTVAFADMCALSLKCTDLPVQAIHCRLHGILPKAGANKQVLDELTRLFSTGLPLVAKLVKVADDERHEVELFSDDGQSFSALLKAKGVIETGPPQKSPTKLEKIGSVLDQCPVGTKLLLHVTVRGADHAWCTALDKEMQDIEKDLNATCPLRVGSVRKSFSVGEYVASQSLEDGCWYRACIIRASSTERWVRYLDYGNDEVNTAVVPLDPEQKLMEPRAVRLSGPVVASCKVGDVLIAKITHVTKGNVLADIMDQESEGAKLGACKLDPWCFAVDCFKDPSNLPKDAVSNGPRSSPSAATSPAKECLNTKELVPKVIHIPVRGVPEKKCNMGLSWKTSDVLFLHQESLMEGLAKMMDKLNEWARTTKESRRHYDVGEYVAAYSKDVQAWHRARVLSDKNVDGTYLVLLVDFGNSECIPPSSLRYLPPQFADYAIFAHCVIPDGGVSPEDPRLEQMLTEEPFAAVQVGCRSGVPIVKLVRRNGICLTDVLSRAGQDASEAKSPKVSQPRPVVQPCPVPAQCFQAIITSTDGRLFYVQPLSRSESLLTITKALQSPPAEPLASCKPHDFVIARSSEDNCWYRAQVLSFASGGKKAEVMYVDYGNCEVMDRETLKPLTLALSREPACALTVELDKVPAQSPDEVAVLVNEEMKIEVVGGNSEKLKVKMTTGNGVCVNDILAPQDAPAEQVRFCIPEATLPAGRSEAVLADRAGNVVYLHLTANVDLLESLLTEVNSSVPGTIPEVVSVGDAVRIKPPGEGLWHRGTIEGISGSGKVKVVLVDAGRVEEVSQEELRYLSGKLATLPALTVAVRLHGLPDLTDSMLKPLKDEAVMVEAVETGPPPVVKLYNEAGECINNALKCSTDQRAPSTPQQAKVIPQRQLPDGRTDVTIVGASSEAATLTVMQSKLATELNTMMADLNAVVSTLPPATIVPQSYLCAKYTVDGLWYRAQVTAKGKSGFLVCFVDFGNEEEVSANDLRALPETFLTIPLFLNKVTVAGIGKIHQDLCKSILEIPACIEVVNRTRNPPCVNVFSEDGTLLNSEFASS